MINDTAFNSEILQTLMESIGAETISTIVTIYIDDAKNQIGQLEKGLMENNRELLHRMGHNLKSSSANVGAMSTSYLAKQIESLSKEEPIATINQTQLSALIKSINITYQENLPYLQKFCLDKL